MLASLLPLGALTLLASGAVASPDRSQRVFSSFNPHPPEDRWDPFEYMSGIAPYHDAPGADIAPPSDCKVASAAFLIRHSCIYANDDEWDDYMKPFVERLQAYKQSEVASFRGAGPLAFLEHWESPINDDNLEKITPPGIDDSFRFGKRLRKLYPKLFPPKFLGKKGREKDDDGVRVPFKVWTASSERDVETAKAFVRGAFPKGHEGDDGEGDGKYLQLVKVNNKAADWSASLTPHKVCPAFSKEPGKPDAQKWLETYGPAPLERMQKLIPNFEWDLKDIIAMQMLCGYETVIDGRSDASKFCQRGLFTQSEFKDFGYWNDLIYHKMTGYGAPVAPYLGVPWLNTSLHNILETDDSRHGHPSTGNYDLLSSSSKLPKPDLPPNATHTQRLFVYFTHREEPPVALVALGIWNQTEVGPLPLDSRPDNRVWQTSHVLPFLGHVAIERLECNISKKPNEREEYARVIVNGAVQRLPRKDLADGPGHSCRLDRFQKYVQSRVEMYGDFNKACEKKDEQE